jgi:hypothetical protein
MRQLQFFTSAELATMRDRTKSRNYSPGNDEFRREHERHRAWGLSQRHARKLQRLGSAQTSKPSESARSPHPRGPDETRPLPRPRSAPRARQPSATLTTPSAAVRTTPSSAVRTTPSAAVRTRPSANVPPRPSAAVRATPSVTVPTTPTPADDVITSPTARAKSVPAAHATPEPARLAKRRPSRSAESAKPSTPSSSDRPSRVARTGGRHPIAARTIPTPVPPPGSEAVLAVRPPADSTTSSARDRLPVTGRSVQASVQPPEAEIARGVRTQPTPHRISHSPSKRKLLEASNPKPNLPNQPANASHPKRRDQLAARPPPLPRR